MGIQLYEHNRKAYEAACLMLEKEGKAAVIHPTGTGKSFIAFKLAEDNPDAKICWLSPSEYIYQTQLQNFMATIPDEDNVSFPNIHYLSYGKLMKNEQSMDTLKPDYIVLDEFHRCGAAEWGRSVKKLLAMYDKARVLGLSATNVRYLDNQRDMAQELFEGCIASEMTLGEAIARGILSAPKYVTAMYSYGKELGKLEQRIKALSNKGLIAKNMELLEQLRRALEQADGLDVVFERHMQKKDGKYIVFCADKEHMDEMKTHVKEWFGKIDSKPNVYTAYYNDAATAREFEAFKADDSGHLKLLFGIDMLNEGVHVEDVDGVILLRPTVSPIIYLQQIGRALSTGKKKEPVIFDLVNNFDSLYCIDYLEQEVGEAFSLILCHEAREHFQERFRIIDETKDCRTLFRQLQDNLSSSWETYYLAARQWYQETGNLKIPKSYVTPTGLTLGSWLQTQRRVRAGTVNGALTEEKIRKLDEIGMVWDIRRDSWEEGYQELLAYHDKYGDVDVKARYVSDNGFALGKWVSNLRAKVRKKGINQALDPKQQKQLEDLGMIWDKNGEKWESYIDAAKAYRQTYGNLDVPAKYVTENGIALGSWLHSIRHGMSGGKPRIQTLSEEQIAQLNELGIKWEKKSTTIWNAKFALAKEYYEEHGNLDIPVAYCVDGVKLGRWISNIRVKRRKPESSGMVLDEGRIRQLDSIGMNWK